MSLSVGHVRMHSYNASTYVWVWMCVYEWECVSVCVCVCMCVCVCVCVCVESIIHNYRGDKTCENTKYLKSVPMVTNFRLLTIQQNHRSSSGECVHFSIIVVSSYFRYGKNLVKSFVCVGVCV